MFLKNQECMVRGGACVVIIHVILKGFVSNIIGRSIK